MKIKVNRTPLVERYIYKNIEVDSPYGYEVEEVAIKDSAIKTYIDLKYSASDIIKLANQIDSYIKNNIDEAYDALIDYYYEMSSDDQEHISPELEDFYDYIDKRVKEDYADEAQRQFDKQQEVNKEYDEFEQSHMRD